MTDTSAAETGPITARRVRQPVEWVHTHTYEGEEPVFGDRSRRRTSAVHDSSWSVGGVIAFVLVLLFAAGGIAFLYNGGTFNCDAVCQTSRVQIAKVQAERDRAVANANANATAGFGNDDETTKQHAVAPPLPPTVVTPPAPPPVVYVVPPTLPTAPYVALPAPPSVPRGDATYPRVSACLVSLGLREGTDFWSVTDSSGNRIDLGPGVRARLEAGGKLDDAVACLKRSYST
ncbi:hypothetical protein C4556_00115 [Candidatus Parcubacteria bacterium]|nr:MAG: hypothetical protein C4556_00115 [Candidatus Parcubacteria bacterium]